MKKYLLIGLLSVFSNASFAHMDFIHITKNGNIKTSITTGFGYEDIRRIEMIGQLAELLSEKMGYDQNIYIGYQHLYTTPEFPDQYAINYNKEQKEKGEERPKITILCYCYKIEPVNILKMVEYAIANIKQIKQTQRITLITLPYDKVIETYSVPSSTIDNVLLSSRSGVIDEILSSKIYRPLKEGENPSISYFFQDNKYHVYKKDMVKEDERYVTKEIVVKTFDNICQFNVIAYSHALVFDTYASFYFIDGQRHNPIYDPREEVSQRHIINEDMRTEFRPYKIFPMGKDRICITTYSNSPYKKYLDEDNPQVRIAMYQREINMIYLADNDVLIQNADDLLNEAAMKQLGIISE